jgi:chorismate mutase
MQRLRLQVDQIDLKMLRLLQQRTKLSGEIGKMKRRHRAVIYVPDRERDLLARLTRLDRGRLSGKVVAAIYREILSSSRAAQGQPPIGLLQASEPTILPASRVCFGACDRFEAKKTWPEIVKGLLSRRLSLALLTGEDLVRALETERWRSEFLKHLAVVSDFPSSGVSEATLAKRVFIVTPRPKGVSAVTNQMLILIECKSTSNAVKSLLRAMSDLSPIAHHLSSHGSGLTLFRLTTATPVEGKTALACVTGAGQATGTPLSILGIYPGTEEHGR